MKTFTLFVCVALCLAFASVVAQKDFLDIEFAVSDTCVQKCMYKNWTTKERCTSYYNNCQHRGDIDGFKYCNTKYGPYDPTCGTDPCCFTNSVPQCRGLIPVAGC